MKPLFKCEIEYFHSFHLFQIYDGFERLRKAGIISAEFKRVNKSGAFPVINVKLNDKIKIIYDTLDGLNWHGATLEENLNYFQNNFEADFFFKRSFTKKLIKHSPDNCKVFPLGLNLAFRAEGEFPEKFRNKVINRFKETPLFVKLYQKSIPEIDDIEFPPCPWKENKILFATRLWDPKSFKSEISKAAMEKINNDRVNCISACKKEFGDRFIGGLIKDEFSEKFAPGLVIPFSLTKKNVFLKNMKSSNICVATTGLSNSIGWKFAEYVAAARAIISEPLNYDLPGDFSEKKNYLSFTSEDELINNIYHLLKNKELIFEMMKNNFEYYHSYVRSDMLVLNSLLTVKENI